MPRKIDHGPTTRRSERRIAAQTEEQTKTPTERTTTSIQVRNDLIENSTADEPPVPPGEEEEDSQATPETAPPSHDTLENSSENPLITLLDPRYPIQSLERDDSQDYHQATFSSLQGTMAGEGSQPARRNAPAVDPNDPQIKALVASAVAAALAELETTRSSRPSVQPSEDEQVHREVTVESAFGAVGTVFKASGIAAWAAFAPFEGPNGENPRYSDKAKARAESPGTFAGDKSEFDSWTIKLRDKFLEDETTFRSEQSRMRFVFNCLKDKARESIETRYQSTDHPFICSAEMIQALVAVYHDPNQASAARKKLSELKFKPGRGIDIHDFISTFNSLAQKSRLPADTWKETLWEHIPKDLDPRLLAESRDSDITYDRFCNYVSTAAYSNQRAYEERQQERRHRPNRSNEGDKSSKDNHRQTQRNEKKDEQTLRPPRKLNVKGLTEAEVEAHLRTGSCFKCHEQGHRADQCPKNESVKAVRAISPKETREEGTSEEESGKE